MGHQVQRSFNCFRFKIDNFSKKKAEITSQTFVTCVNQWYLRVYPKGDTLHDDHMSVYLFVGNPRSLGKGWKRNTSIQIVLLNQSNKELYRSPSTEVGFCGQNPGWGFQKTLPLHKLQEKGFLEKDILIVEVHIIPTGPENVDGKGRSVSEKEKTVDIKGFQVFASQATSARKMFAEHPDIAEGFKPKNQVVKTEYMRVLLNLVDTESSNANYYSDLSELMEQGFKLEWLNSKLGEVSLQRKKANVDDQKVDEPVKNLELMKLDSKLNCLKTKLEEVYLEKKKSDDADGFRFQTLEERVKNLELMELDDKLERKKSDDVDGCRVNEMEERINNLEMMLSDLKVELDKKKTKSCDDGFLLVDEVA